MNPPPNAENIGNSTVPSAWMNFFMSVYRSTKLDYGSGTTAQRPTKNLTPGGRYFDTSLGANGQPIWVDKTGAAWVLADGTAA